MTLNDVMLLTTSSCRQALRERSLLVKSAIVFSITYRHLQRMMFRSLSRCKTTNIM